MLVVLAALGIPKAACSHGYVGFIFGAVKASAWWSTPLMPIIFLCSAIVSGIAMSGHPLPIGMNCSGRKDRRRLHAVPAQWLALRVLSVTPGLLEIMALAYEAADEWSIIKRCWSTNWRFVHRASTHLRGFDPIILLGIVVLMSRYPDRSDPKYAVLRGSLMLLVQVFAMRLECRHRRADFLKACAVSESAPSRPVREGGIALAVLIFVFPLVFILVQQGSAGF